MRSNSNVTRGGLSAVSTDNAQPKAGGNANADVRGRASRDNGNDASDFLRVGEDRNVHRIPPRERDLIYWDRPGRFWGPEPHYFGYRIHALPPRCRIVTYWGIDYRFYNGVYYRPWGTGWYICRPPFGVCIDPVGVLFDAVRFSFYNSTYRVYRAIDANNRYIDEQNRIIAQNNATIAAQNAAMALNMNRANDSYSVANTLGLAQSYAYANQEYYYQDGVFYIINSTGQYQVIVPPAGALVSSLPDDYDVISLNGNDYYKVDDTVYRLTLVDGNPYLEVLGQMYGDLAARHNQYR